MDLYFRGPEDDSERVETCRPKIALYVINLLCVLTDTLYFKSAYIRSVMDNSVSNTVIIEFSKRNEPYRNWLYKAAGTDPVASFGWVLF